MAKRQEKRVKKPMAYLRRTLPPLPSMSDTLLDFAAPLLDGLDPKGPAEAFRPSLVIAMHLWNCSLREADVRTDEGEVAAGRFRKDLIDDLQPMLKASYPECMELVEEMFQRKRELFPDDLRTIVAFHAKDTPDGVHVLVSSSF
jgi:hypothetical protein